MESFQNLKQQEKFLGTAMGKGILLLSLSLIKYRSVKTSLVHSHWSRMIQAWLSLVESFIVLKYCYASSLMP